MKAHTMLVLIAVIPALLYVAEAGSCTDCHNRGYNWYCQHKDECYKYQITCGFSCIGGTCEPTSQCGSCYKGYNCSCNQCQTQGYSYYCPKPFSECYNTWATCEVSCPVGCIETTACAPNITCPKPSMCNPAQSTCCMSSDNQPFCSPYPNATCCNYKQQSCPQGQFCDTITGACVPPNTNTTQCQSCMNLMNEIATKGCSEACSTTGNGTAAYVCQLINSLHLCDWLVKEIVKNQSPAETCGMFGVCGSGDCKCGYCQSQVFGQNCLSLPNKCPADSRGWGKLKDGKMRTEDELIKYIRQLNASRALGRPKMGKDICLDGWCDVNTLGCCLTCA